MQNQLHEFLKDQAASIDAKVEGKTLIDYIDKNAEDYPDFPAINTPANNEYSAWDAMSWSEYRVSIHNLASGLIDIGLNPGDTSFIMSNNTKEHNIADLAIMHAGATPSTLYKQLKSGQIEYVANLMEAKIAIAGDLELFNEIDNARKNFPNLEKIVIINGFEEVSEKDYVLSYHELMERGASINAKDNSLLVQAIKTVTPDSLACLIFTSGTTGHPKGVMITHRNVLWTNESLFGELVPASMHPRIVSYLPMAHIAARAGDHYQAIYKTGQIFPVPVLEDMSMALPTIQPSVFLAVPRVWEKFQAGLLNKINESDKAELALKAIDNGLERVKYEQSGEKVPLKVKILDTVFNKLVFSKFKEGLGIQNTEYFVTAAAAMNPDVQRWFHAIHIDVTEIYGMTEDTGPATVGIATNAVDSLTNKLKSAGVPIPKVFNPIGKVGIPLAGTEIKILEDGELCMRGGHVTNGYYKQEEATKEAFDSDGWLHTGDLAEIGEDGYVKIIGRKKEIIITSGGKNIAPVELEDLIKPHPLVGQICMVGDGRKFLSALIVLDREGTSEQWAKENSVDYDIETFHNNPIVIDAIQSQIDKANSKVANVQQIKKFTILEEEWTDTSGELTPTLKLKRNVINETYKDQIDAMYKE